MYDFFGAQIDTTKMTLEELEETRDKVDAFLANLNCEIRWRKMANYKYPSNEESLA